METKPIPSEPEAMYAWTRQQAFTATRGSAPAPITGGWGRIDSEHSNDSAMRERIKRLDAMSVDEAQVLLRLPVAAQPAMAQAYALAYAWLCSAPLDFWRINAGQSARKLLALAAAAEPEIAVQIGATRQLAGR